jgi:hypothetical protein
MNQSYQQWIRMGLFPIHGRVDDGESGIRRSWLIPLSRGSPGAPGAVGSTKYYSIKNHNRKPSLQGMRDKAGLRRPESSRKTTATGRGLNTQKIKYKEVSCH